MTPTPSTTDREKSLSDFKDEVARNAHYDNWGELLDNPMSSQRIVEYTDAAHELYRLSLATQPDSTVEERAEKSGDLHFEGNDSEQIGYDWDHYIAGYKDGAKSQAPISEAKGRSEERKEIVGEIEKIVSGYREWLTVDACNRTETNNFIELLERLIKQITEKV